jgi:hypothetical protein
VVEVALAVQALLAARPLVVVLELVLEVAT